MAARQRRHRHERDLDVDAQDSLCVIFLDMDGVMQPFNYLENDNDPAHRSSSLPLFPDSTMHALHWILEQVPIAKLVLSSTWRVQDTFIQQIEDAFHAYAIQNHSAPLQDVRFYDITNPHMHSERQHEIHDWLHSYRLRHCSESGATIPVQAWVALDDEELLQGPANQRLRNAFEGHVVRTDSHTGLTLRDAQQAVSLLREQLPISSPGGLDVTK